MMPRKVLLLALFCLSCTKSGKATQPEEKAEKKTPVQEQVTRKVYDWPPTSSVAVDLVHGDERLTKNFYIILDGSGSMASYGCSGKLTKAQAAIMALVNFRKAVGDDANLGLLIFDQKGTSERVPLGSNNAEAFASALVSMEVGGGTPLGTAMEKGLSALETQARAQQGYGEYNLVIVTDGEANENDAPGPMVKKLTADTPVLVHTIGFCIGEDHALNQPGLTIYKAANNPKELASGLEEVLAESETFSVAEFE
jgi:uncharacterized protein YegL